MLDRTQIRFKPLAERRDKVYIERDHVPLDAAPRPLPDEARASMAEAVERIRGARDRGAPRMLAFGAHTIKNGLAPVLGALIEHGWITHLATNGAGIIHDWEFGFQGHSSEDVRENVTKGEFGTWEQTGFFLNLAINVGAYAGLGYGESVGRMVEQERLEIPDRDALREGIVEATNSNRPGDAAAIADMLDIVRRFDLPPGTMVVPHPYKGFCLQAAAYRLGVPFTAHPMFGHDIIYTHPMSHGASIGRAAERDFLRYAASVADLDHGVYLSIGSAVMSPMVFEKSLSMAQNLAIQRGQHIDHHYILVADLQPSHWDWTQGEPPEDNPDYYLRYNKTFARMGGAMRYVSIDNRDLLLALWRGLNNQGIAPCS